MTADTPSRSDDEFVAAINASLARLRRLCVMYCRNAADREDLLQDIVVAAWRARATHRGSAAFATWLYRIAVNCALQRIRRLRARPATEPRDLERFPAAHSPTPDDRLDLTRLSERLDVIDRAVLWLYLEERSYSEIAEVMGTSANAVGARMTRIRDRLRTLSTGGSRGA